MEPKENGEKPERKPDGTFAEGNPGGPGRPPGSLSLVGLLKKHLEEIPSAEKTSKATSIILKLIAQAERGDSNSQKLIFNYIEGLPQAKVDVTSGGKPIPILGGITKELNGSTQVFGSGEEEEEG